MTHGLGAVGTSLAVIGLTWLLQSSALLALGLLAGRVLKRSGSAVQSGVYRTTLAAVLICPVASAALSRAGFAGFVVRLPATAVEVQRPRALADARPAPSIATDRRPVPLDVPAALRDVPSPSFEPPRGATPMPVASSPRPAIAARPGLALIA